MKKTLLMNLLPVKWIRIMSVQSYLISPLCHNNMAQSAISHGILSLKSFKFSTDKALFLSNMNI